VTTDPAVCDEFEWDDLGTGCVRCRRLFEDHIAKIDTVNVDNKTLISLTELEPGFIKDIFNIIDLACKVVSDPDIIDKFYITGNRSLEDLYEALLAMGVLNDDE